MNAIAYKFIYVCTKAETHDSKPLYLVLNRKSNDELGVIFWYKAWRMWVLQSRGDTVWSTDCLADVRDAIAKITAHYQQVLR